MAGDGGGAGTLPPHVLVPPTWLPEARLEVSVHSCPARMLPDLQRVFPSLPPEAAGRLLILPTFQPTKHDMVSITVDCDDERDALLEHFAEWAQAFCLAAKREGHWADFTDPCSGFPALAWLPPSQMLTKAAACSYPDVQGAHLLLRYDTVEAGCCRVLLHPRWRSKCYPGTVFTTADVNTVRRLLKLPPP